MLDDVKSLIFGAKKPSRLAAELRLIDKSPGRKAELVERNPLETDAMGVLDDEQE
jgi:hypothetical protein